VDAPVDALATLAAFCARSKRASSVNFPIGYVRQPAGTKPMSARLFTSSELRLRLHMTLVMRATKAPHTLTKSTTHYLARLMNLPGDTGPRRINDAMKFLRGEKLVVDTPLADGKPGLLLLQPDGSGEPWQVSKKLWIGVPFSLWSNGWILQLGGRELAVFLALTDLNYGSKELRGETMTGHRKAQYGLADDTWTRATKKLEALGLLEITSERFGSEELEVRTRNRYRLLVDKLEEQPDWTLG